MRSSWLTVDRNALLAASASSAAARARSASSNSRRILVLLLVQLPVGRGVVERHGGVRRQALHHVQVMVGVGVLLEALDGDEAEHPVLGLERQVDERLRRLRHRAVFEPLALLLVTADVFLVVDGEVVDEHRLAVLDAPHRQLVGIAGVARVRRVALALLDRQPVLDLLALGMVETDAEDVGVGELVDALVELAEDGVEVERRGDLAADAAQQLDLFLALALGAGQRLGRFGPQPRFGELRPFALFAEQASALETIDADDQAGAEQQIGQIRRPRAVPRREDREGVGGLVADRSGDVARPHVEPEVAEAEIGEVAAGLAAPRRPVAVEAIEPRLKLGRFFVEERRRRVLESQRGRRGRQRRRRWSAGAGEHHVGLTGGDAAQERRVGGRRRSRAAVQVVADEVALPAEPGHAVGVDDRESRGYLAEAAERRRVDGPRIARAGEHGRALATIHEQPAADPGEAVRPGESIGRQLIEERIADEGASRGVEAGDVVFG